MKKSMILECAYRGYKITDEEFAELLNQLKEYEKSKAFETGEELAKGIYADMPHLRIIHDYSMRRYAKVTAENSTFIKTIVIIYVILSIIGAIAYMYLLK